MLGGCACMDGCVWVMGGRNIAWEGWGLGPFSWRFDGDCVGCIASILMFVEMIVCMHCPGACLMFCMRGNDSVALK